MATIEHLNAFEAATTEILRVSGELAALGFDSVALVQHNVEQGNLDAALAAGLVTFNHLSAEFERLMGAFQKAAADLIGEHPKPSEGPADFFWRVVEMDFAATAKRNGIIFEWVRP